MNRIKEFKMNPEMAYRFAIGEVQIETKELLEERLSQEIRTFLVLNSNELVSNFIKNDSWHSNRGTKVNEYARRYFHLMTGVEPFLTNFEKSAEFACLKLFHTKDNQHYWLYDNISKFRKNWEKPNILTEEETEIFLKSPKWAVKYAKFTNKRFSPSVEKRFIEGKELGTRASQTARAYVLEYCKLFSIILDNYNEILLKEGFGEKKSKRESEANKAYLKAIQEEKEKCLNFLCKLMQSNSLTEKDSIEKLMECLN